LHFFLEGLIKLRREPMKHDAQDRVEARQLRLFDARDRSTWGSPPIAPFPGKLSSDSSLALSLSWFADELARQGYAENTRVVYLKAIRRLIRYLGRTNAVDAVTTGDLKRFQAWLQRQDLAPKTRELTVTAVRTFFSLLHEGGILDANPARGVYPVEAASPLPDVLFRNEMEDIRRKAAELAIHPEDPDPRPALLLTLFLDLGLRLGEARRLKLTDVDASNRLRPVVHVRYDQQRHRAKRRRLVGPPDLVQLLELYVDAYPRTDGSTALFPWSRRRLQQIVEVLGEQAGIQRKITPNKLRWTYALLAWKADVTEERMRRQLGLSELGWRDVRERLEALC
jgi:site-specific recombinase XerD